MENNNAIRVIASQISIFRGDKVSNLSIDIEVHERFLTPDQEIPKYCLTAKLEKLDERSNMTSVLSSTQVKMAFERDAMKDDTSMCTIFYQRRNSLSCILDNNLFQSNEKFRIIVAASPYGKEEVECFGVSQEITATDFALEIETNYSISPVVEYRQDKNNYAWYQSSRVVRPLEACVYLKQAPGTAPICLEDVDINVELLYETGEIPAPLYMLKNNEKRLLNMSPETIKFSTSQIKPTYFQYRIEEVSYYHRKRGGFKLRVSVPNFRGSQVIHPAVTADSLYVYSKKRTSKRKRPNEPHRDPTLHCHEGKSNPSSDNKHFGVTESVKTLLEEERKYWNSSNHQDPSILLRAAAYVDHPEFNSYM